MSDSTKMRNIGTGILNAFRGSIILSLFLSMIIALIEMESKTPVATVVTACLFVFLAVTYGVGAVVCYFLPFAWTCDWAGTHRPQSQQGFDGCSFTSKCKKCGNEILQDGQGNWF